MLIKRFKTALLAGMLLMLGSPAIGQSQAPALNAYCQIAQAEASRKEDLRRQAFEGDQAALNQYLAVVQQHAQTLQRCRRQTWPNDQAVWLRLYPCDLQPGILEAVLDRIVNLGYNQIYVEALYSGQILLPESDNPTAWPSVVQADGYEQRDLLAEAIEKGRQRGLTSYAWVFTLNYGYSYAQRADRQSVLARNGRGQDSIAFAQSGATSNLEEVFVDPYHLQAQRDFEVALTAIAKRQPTGVLLDYIRYSRGVGSHSVVTKVEDLWIYGEGSRLALFRRALNYQGLELMRRYVSRGYLVDSDISDVANLYPNEVEPLWQSRVPSGTSLKEASAAALRPTLQNELWRLSVAHAVQGVVDFVTRAGQTAQQQGIQSGAVFFPGGNRSVGGGYDSRLQYWDRFPSWMAWHPMAYAICGNSGCILDEIRRVMAVAKPRGQAVKPVLAGVWGQSIRNRPALEVQMQAIRRSIPEINSISHFAYSWQDPEFDRSRKFCRL
ncbi:MAG: hypothetical protein AAGH78_03150 [Cyanobacteria bacterium P01_H01_bin.58]